MKYCLLKRPSRTSELFKDVSCTSTPFFKQRKDSRGLEKTSDNKSLHNSRKGREQMELISISSDSLASNSSVRKGSSRTTLFDEGTSLRRRSSSRSSISQLSGVHNCISCRNSSVKQVTTPSTTSEPSLIDDKSSSSSTRISKSRKSSASVLESSYKETSPVKRASGTPMTTPLLHRKSLEASLSVNTPEKTTETEDETPKTSIKPARRSSKANQSAYNPVLEDITPVTPERLMVSGFTEEVFKTPINTPGLFESIRKSVIRSRKRNRESTGSTMKDSKRARVDFEQHEQLESSNEESQEQSPQQKRQKSPANRLSNFEDVKKLMKTPPKSPKNDLRNIPNLRRLVSPKTQNSPKNDLTNVAGVKKMFGTPKDLKSPKNDLSDVAGVKKVFENSPRNDLTRIPNIRRIMSPKVRNSPKNDLTAPIGVKRLLKTPRAQKGPRNDLGDVSGVANIFNVSGVEVLHQGSDIENSEDLFTKLTGKRPVKAYPRGKSLTPHKEEQEQQTHSRKTMGDLPVCSPRVQQWVDEHSNVVYETAAGNASLNDKEDLFVNISENPKRKSKSARSVSPKKPSKDDTSRRKTYGDALADNPNVTEWKAEQAKPVKTRKSSTAKRNSVKTELLSPNPVNANVQDEIVTPQLKKSKTEVVTPQQQSTPSHLTPASAKVKKGSAKPQHQAPQMEENQEEAAITSSSKGKRVPKVIVSEEKNHEKSTETPKKNETKHLEIVKQGKKGKRILSSEDIDALSAASSSPVQELVVKKTRGRPKAVKCETDQAKTPDALSAPSRTRRGEKPSESTTSPKGEKIPDVIISEEMGQQKSTETPKKIENKHLEVVKQGKKGKRIRSSEDLDALSAASSSPVQELVVKKTRGRPRALKSETDQEVTPDVLSSPRRTRRGEKASEKIPKIIVSEEKNQQKSTETPDKIENKHLEVVKQGKKGKRIRSSEDLDALSAASSSPVQELVAKKTRSRPRAVKAESDQLTPDVLSPPSRTRRGEKPTGHSIETEVKKPTSRGRKDPKEDQQEIKSQKEEESTQNEISESKKPSETIEIKKPSSRGRRGKKEEQPETASQKDEESNENEATDFKKPSESDTVVVKKPAPRGRRGKKESESHEDVINQIEESELKKSTRGRKGGKKTEEEEKNDGLTEESAPTNTRTRRGKKEEPEAEVETDQPVEESKVTKAAGRGRRGKKTDENQEETDMINVAAGELQETKPRGRGRRTAKDEVEENTVQEVVSKKTTTRSKKEENQASRTENIAEVVASPARKTTRKGALQNKEGSDSTPSSPVVKTNRGRRGAKASEEVPSEVVEDDAAVAKAPARKGRGKKIVVEEQESQIDEDDANVEPLKKATRGRGKKEVEDTQEDNKTAKKPPTRGRGKQVAEELSEEDTTSQATRGRGKKEVEDTQEDNKTAKKPPTRGRGKQVAEELSEEDTTSQATRGRGKKEVEDTQEDNKTSKKPPTRGRGKQVVEESSEEDPTSQKPNNRKPKNKVVEEVIAMDVDSPRTARAKRGVNKKYSIDEYEVADKKGGSKRKVHFASESNSDLKKETPEVDTRKSKRTRK